MTTESFKQAYDVLQRHAQTLRDQREPNIDDLLNIVTESVQAYKVCQQRIEAVELALEKALSDTGAPMSDSPGPKAAAPVAPAVLTALTDDADDVPF